MAVWFFLYSRIMTLDFIGKLSNSERIIFGIASLFFFSLFFSKYLLSISTGLFFLSSFWIAEQAFQNWSSPKIRYSLLSLFGIFLITVFSLLNSENSSIWLHFVKLKLPFLLFAVAFMNFPKWSKLLTENIFNIFIIISSIAAAYVLINYMANFSIITESIGRGKSIPTPIDHGKFSVLVSFSIFLVFIENGNRALNGLKFKSWQLVIALCLFLFLHILSVRSGFVILYAGLLILSFSYLLKLKKIALLILILVAMIIVPIIAYQTIPSFKKKVDYTQYDFKMQQQGTAQNYSDGERIVSLKIGAALVRSAPIFGVGIGDLRELMTKEYAKKYPQSTKVLLPHNEYMLYASGYGLLGLLIFILLVYFPLRYSSLRRDKVYVVFALSSTLLFMVEKPLEETVYISFFCFISCLCFNQNLHSEKQCKD